MTTGRVDWEVWLRRGCALLVAGVAAYASYEHQSAFALRGSADATSAALWPLSVDGLLVLATVGLLKADRQTPRRVRVADGETGSETGPVVAVAAVEPTTQPAAEPAGEPTAQEIMWAHFVREQEHGRMPTGAELDRLAGTNNYGRTVLRQWREQCRIPPAGQRNGHRLTERTDA